MNKNLEVEYKVLVTKEQFEALAQEYNGLTFVRQINTYYDTADLQIRKQKGSMRIREKEGSFLFTLKKHVDGGLLEFEKELSDNSLAALEDEEIQALLTEYQLSAPLVRLTELTTDRAVIETENAELCFDHSIYNGYEDYEIEYEYKKEHDGLLAFQKILGPIHIVYEKNCISKSKRALTSI